MFESEEIVVFLQIRRTGAPDIATAVADEMHRVHPAVEDLDDPLGVVFVGGLRRVGVDLGREDNRDCRTPRRWDRCVVGTTRSRWR